MPPVTEPTSPWRPTPRLRVVAVAVTWRGPRLLVAAIRRDDGSVKGWRPLGGGVEFGEASREAVVREMREEVDAAFRPTRLLGVIENLFEHEGRRGHEVVFAWQGVLDEPGLAAAEAFATLDGEAARWRDLAAFHPGEPLFPEGLAPLLAPAPLD